MITFLIAVGIISGFGMIFGFILGFTSFYFKVKENPILEKIDRILPQSQCGQCGYPGCRPYAESIINNGENINKCTPGGKKTTSEIAELLNLEYPLSIDGKLIPERKVAFIDESNCVGCTKCIHVCPVDAIIGTINSSHTVVKDFCTGCNLCVTPCPTKCISMISIKEYD